MSVNNIDLIAAASQPTTKFAELRVWRVSGRSLNLLTPVDSCHELQEVKLLFLRILDLISFL